MTGVRYDQLDTFSLSDSTTVLRDVRFIDYRSAGRAKAVNVKAISLFQPRHERGICMFRKMSYTHYSLV